MHPATLSLVQPLLRYFRPAFGHYPPTGPSTDSNVASAPVVRKSPAALYVGVMIFYRLRPGVRHPSFQSGELYRFLEETQPAGYIFLDLAGRPRCVPQRDFERIETEDLALIREPVR